MKSSYVAILRLICPPPQIRSKWIPEEGCVSSSPDIAKLNFISTLATDTILFLMMLAGLVNLHLQGGGMLSLGKFLWKQVSGDTFPFRPFTDVFC
jgi:hypothetical protein